MEQPSDIDPFIVGRTAYDQGDYSTAQRLWTPLAVDGVPAAQCNLGSLYHFGWGVPQDFAEARGWYRKAANQRYAPAQHNLGVFYHNGQGVAQNFVHAYMW
ncbi:MAG: tetratricopeptide repeat protein [Rhodospirillaceae bacterium]